MAAKDRTLYVLKYLWENSDEEHPATVSDILSALASEDIKVERPRSYVGYRTAYRVRNRYSLREKLSEQVFYRAALI